MKPSAIRAAVALTLTAASAIALTGCTALEPTFTAKTLTQVVNGAKVPSGYEVTTDQADAKAASDKYQQFTNLYKEGSISPERCTDLGAIEGLTSAADFKGSINDKVYDIARYTSEASTNHYEFFGVQGRIFSKSGAAAQFLNAVRKIASKCVSGYITHATDTGSNSSPALDADSVAVTRLSGADGVKGLELIENSSAADNDPSYRVVYVQRGNAVIAISTGIKPGSDIDFQPSNELVTSIAKQLAAAEGN